MDGISDNNDAIDVRCIDSLIDAISDSKELSFCG